MGSSFQGFKTRVVEGVGAVRSSAAQLRALGKRPIVVMGRSSARRCGAWTDICEALGSEPLYFDRVEENPSVATVLKAAETAQNGGADCVIGVGGGSPMDAAKAVAWLMLHPEAGERELFTAGDDTAAPMAMVPTTCGTGSEITGVSVLTPTGTGSKRSMAHKVYPDLALVDGGYLRSASLNLILSTGCDALCHLMESRLNSRCNTGSLSWSESGLRLWAANRTILEQGTGTDSQLTSLMRASLEGGCAIACAGTGLPHALSYPLTIQAGVPHGTAVGYFLAGYLSELRAEDSDAALRLAGFSGIEDYALWFRRSFTLPNFSEELLERAVREVCDNKPKLATAPFNADLPTLERISRFMLKFE